MSSLKHATSNLVQDLKSKLNDAILTLQQLYKKIAERHTNISGFSHGTLHLIDPKTHELKPIVQNCSEIVDITLPLVINSILQSKVTKREKQTANTDTEPSKQRMKPNPTVMMSDLSKFKKWFLGQMRYCDLGQTGEVTDGNMKSEYMKTHKPSNKSLDRKISLVAPDISDAAHWPQEDQDVAKFISMWGHTSLSIMELYHMVAIELHLSDCVFALECFITGESKCVENEMCAASKSVFEFATNLFKKANKKIYTSGNKFDMSDTTHAQALSDWITADFSEMHENIMDLNNKERLINTPHRYVNNKKEDCTMSEVKLTSNIMFNTPQGAKHSGILTDLWGDVIKHELLVMHRDMQYNAAYAYKGVSWSKALAEKLYAEYWPSKCNVTAAEAIEDMISKGIAPAANNIIVLQNSRGENLASPIDGKPLSVFEASCAFGELSRVKFQNAKRDAAIVLCDFHLRTGIQNQVTYYGNINSLQPVLSARFVDNVMRATWWKGHQNEGMPTDAPEFSNPFDNFNSFMRKYTSVTITKTRSDAILEQRHDAFVEYKEEEETATTPN